MTAEVAERVYEVHPAAELFPMISGVEFELFVADIRDNGQMEPIMLDQQNRVIDGRNRLRACERLGRMPEVRVYHGDNVLQYVISHNLHRRHLTDSQRAMIGAKIADRTPGLNALALAHRAKGDLLDIKEIPPSIGEVAEMLAVTEGSVTFAKRVMRDGVPELQDLVSDGTAPVTTAARVATTLSPEEQTAYVEKVRAGADPVKSAPPPKREDEQKKLAVPQPPKFGGNRRKHVDQIDAVINGLHGYVAAFAGVTELDASVTAEEAVRLWDDLSKQIGALRRINQLLLAAKDRNPT